MKCILMKCCTWFDNSPFDYPLKAERLEEVERELERPSIWDNPRRSDQTRPGTRLTRWRRARS